MSKLFITIILLSIFFLPKLLFSQNINLRDNYFSNCLYNVNPSAAGYDGGFISSLSISKKWVNIQDAPSVQVFSNSLRFGSTDFYDDEYFISRPIFDFAPRVGVGLTLYNETSGPIKETGFLFAYAYHIPLNRNKLSFGLSGSYSQTSINSVLLQPNNEYDPELYTNTKDYFPSIQFGSMYYSRDLLVSLSLRRNLISNSYYQTITFTNVNLFSLYNLYESSRYSIESSIMLDYTYNYQTTIDCNLRLHYFNKHWLLISLRDFQAFGMGIGLSFNSRIQFQYQFKTSNSSFNKHFVSSHSVGLSLNVERIIQNR
ncbi:PorP/SprF family type IX secretion system membrane protein [Carboxylicivirga sp. RSCT41]|uniref:PorP/SprF family type IX secretion system membrane protein n=1 Tax=Carboxylicivirga agarovorans TaxID=3417570 RepID=UPI003D331212